MFFILTRWWWTEGLLATLLAIVPFISQSQVVQSGRMEIPLRTDFESFSVISLDTSGVALYRSFAGSKGDNIELTRLDTALKQVWNGFLPIPKGLSIQSAKAIDGKIYLFLKNPANKNFTVYAVSAADGTYTSFTITNVILFNPSEFVVTREAILIGGYFNFRPLVLHYSLKERRSRILPGFLNEPGELTQIKVYPDGNIDVIVSAKNMSRKKCLWIRHFDNAGDLIKTVVLEPGEKKNLIFGRAANMDNDNQVIAGVYGRNAEFSRGIFVADINAYGEYVIRYYNFADLQNFFHYMRAGREKRIRERIERRRIKGKKTKFNYRFLVHELIPYGNQFVMLGEAFFPTYSQSAYGGNAGPNYSPWSYGVNNRNFYSSAARNDIVFTGFQYTHAVAIGFDNNAKLVWDNSFEIKNLKSFQLEQLVKLVPDQNKINLLYIYENAIRSKVIQNSKVLEGVTQDPISTFKEGKPLKNRVYNSKLEYWYAHHLFVYGIQEFREKNEETGRKVFFINKLSAH